MVRVQTPMLRMTSVHSANGAMGASVANRHALTAGVDRWQAIVLICVASIIPLLMVDLPPLVDIYGHLGRYAVQTDLANRPELQPYYSFEWQLIGNLGADLLVQALHPIVGLEMAVRMVVILTQLLASTGILLVSREIHGRVTPFAVCALPLIYGLPFNYGFLNFSLAMALGMLAFVLWMRLRRAGRTSFARFWLGAGGLLVWICHAYGWAFLGLLCGSAMLAEIVSAKQRPMAAAGHLLAACWPLLFPLVPMIAWRTGSGGMALTGSSLTLKLMWLASAFRNTWIAVDAASVFLVGSLIYWAIRSKTVSFNKGLGIAALLCLACFLILPLRVFGSLYADMRLAPYTLMIALLAISPRGLDSRSRRILMTLAFAFFIGRTLTTGLAYVEQEKRVDAVLPALDRMPKGSRVAFFVVAPCERRWALPVLDHVGGIALARRSVFVNNMWQEPGANPLIVHYDAATPFEHEPSNFVQDENCAVKALPALSQVLAHFPHPSFTHVWIVGTLPDPLVIPSGLEPIPHAGKGALFAIRHPE
jgi:hypothetical protein